MSEVKVHQTLGSGAVVDANDSRVIVSLAAAAASQSQTAISSAVLNGGIFTHKSPNIINANVPIDYDGISPDPDELLRRMSEKEGMDPSSTIGLLTAASMKTLRIASRNADGVFVDVIVTAGISNARAAGVDSDYLGLGNDRNETPSPGTINTVVITNAELSKSALVEAHAISIEAKCAASADMGIACVKSGDIAQGTGTDATVLISTNGGRHIPYAGKHTLFAELLAQAVKQATTEALLTNIEYIYGSPWRYALHKYRLALGRALGGSRPCIPPAPMMPVPSSPLSISIVGSVFVLLAYVLPAPRSARIVLAACAWDRYLPSVPLVIHPVVLTGKLISTFLKYAPNRVFTSPTLGFLAGCVLLGSVLGVSLSAAELFLRSATIAVAVLGQQASLLYPNQEAIVRGTGEFCLWILEIMFVNSSCTLQLLCTLALQMARFQERKQLSQARAQLSWLCSRDSSQLNAYELAAGTLESLSENLSDSYVAPLFWYVLLGPLGALFYRVANTLDSRVGYHGKFEWLGKPSARFDDLINLIPARLTAILRGIAATFVNGCNAKNGLKAAWFDCSQCESPNAGWPMAAMAGLLGIVLEKKGEYRLGTSVVSKVSVLPSPAIVRRGQQVAQLAGVLAVALSASICWYIEE